MPVAIKRHLETFHFDLGADPVDCRGILYLTLRRLESKRHTTMYFFGEVEELQGFKPSW